MEFLVTHLFPLPEVPSFPLGNDPSLFECCLGGIVNAKDVPGGSFCLLLLVPAPVQPVGGQMA